ncbi:fasciclin domain-containing protein [Pricia sp. S334]|uniref:Fasciclin domain-containing protein n=1 Tax=Pricia mediterranea TaxID=3076079 RepID=A0ABU3L1J3_9FLAO|nr:fasciclin domain-containing protein [Pricia sp. S334]MDT7827601.1 fasciclin domain-containing protein [Pricia sp. S334]
MIHSKLFGILVLVGIFVTSCGEKKKDVDAAEKLDEALSVEAYENSKEDSIQSAVDAIIDREDFATLTKGLKSAELIETLDGKDSISLFAPTNDAFSKLPEGKVADLMQPAGKNTLISILKYHVVKGNHSLDDLKSQLNENNGALELETLEGEVLKVSMENDELLLTDPNGNTAKIVKSDIAASKDAIFGIDNVLKPDQL